MDVSVWLARVLGPLKIVVGAAVLFNPTRIIEIALGMYKNARWVAASGVAVFAVGLAIVLFHNVWAADWRAIITVFGWITLFKGVGLVLMPRVSERVAEVFAKHTKLVTIPWAVMLVIGAFLTLRGYGS